ncbi:MAG TPA: DUF4012 domain-containing protein [Patescibacteria group bacterium]|nr:DUF4012 domain-containing protein [Patescibacteria group bacterium]
MKKYFLLTFAIILFVLFFYAVRTAYFAFGFDHPKDYVVLLQNNTELRPTGGFLGSFARIRVRTGRIELLKVEDIYVPDGQIDGHVDPPWPIQAAFGQGWFRLRDSNWDPDFVNSVETLNWFFTKGGETQPDGYIALNFIVFRDILRVIGPVYIANTNEYIDASSAYDRIQTEVERDFFPGSIRKRSVLADVGRSAFEKLHNLSLVQYVRLMAVVVHSLQNKQLFIFSFDTFVQKLVQMFGFSGSIERKYGGDYLSINEANLGANKANALVERQMDLQTHSESGALVHTLKIHYTNSNPFSLKRPPLSFGGAYIAYVRLILPAEAVIQSLQVGNQIYGYKDLDAIASDLSATMDQKANFAFYTIENDALLAAKHLQSFGFFIFVDALAQQDIKVSYFLSNSWANRDRMLIQKQSGIEAIPVTLNLYGQKRNFLLQGDMVME